MTEGRISTELSEPERRKLVKNIAERGSAGHRIKEETVQPSYDYAAAAEAAIAADPVELPPAAAEELSGMATQVSGDANRYAEAQRAIFERGQQRELDYGNAFYDRKVQQHEATNVQLSELQAELAEARKAALRGRGSGLDAETKDAIVDVGAGVTAGIGDFLRSLQPTLPPGVTPEDIERAGKGQETLGEDWAFMAEDTFNGLVENGFTEIEAITEVRKFLINEGFPAGDVIGFLRGLQLIYSPDTFVPSDRYGPGGSGMDGGTSRPGWMGYRPDPNSPGGSGL